MACIRFAFCQINSPSHVTTSHRRCRGRTREKQPNVPVNVTSHHLSPLSFSQISLLFHLFDIKLHLKSRKGGWDGTTCAKEKVGSDGCGGCVVCCDGPHALSLTRTHTSNCTINKSCQRLATGRNNQGVSCFFAPLVQLLSS